MQRQSSPFAALTSKEQLERWREFQSIRLPYIQGDLEPTPAEEPPKPKVPAPQRGTPQAAAAKEQASWQTTRHKQYDAVMQRMVAASKKTVRYEQIR